MLRAGRVFSTRKMPGCSCRSDSCRVAIMPFSYMSRSGGADVFRPCIFEWAPLLQQVGTVISGLDLIFDGVSLTRSLQTGPSGV